MNTKNISLPEKAQVVIVGGGIIGCSVAYHLTKLGYTDVVVLERAQLTSGTTWHAAGLIVSGLLSDETSADIFTYGRDLYSRLEQETGLATGFKSVGYLQVACNEERLEEMRRSAAFMRTRNIDCQEVSVEKAKELWPKAKFDDVIAAFYTPEDGRANPVDLTMSLARGAKMGGAKIIEGVSVTGVKQCAGKVTGVTTELGDIDATYVVNCAGMWARQFGELAGVSLPLQAAEHYYLITDDMDGMHRDLPVLEDPDSYAYYREEVGSLMIGLFEPVAKAWNLQHIPENFIFGELEPDWERMAPFLEAAYERVPAARELGIRKFFCGPESFTPDLSPLVGETSELQNFFVACGLNSLGILSAGGIGRLLAKWIVDGRPDLDVTALNVNRFHPCQRNPKYLDDRLVEVLGKMYESHYPNLGMSSARNVKQSVLHERLVAAGAFFVESAGWELADWFAPEGEKAEVERYSWGRQNWFKYQEAEHHACRNDVTLMDMSFMAKFLVQGNDAEKVLNNICCNDIAVEPGRIVYTQWVNENGGLEADLTVTRLTKDTFMVICSDTTHGHVKMWMDRNIAKNAHAFVTDVTSSYSQINLHGPKARSLMEDLTHADVSNESFPYLSAKEIDIDYARVIAIRVTYVGELGWELYIPTEHALQVYDRIVAAGKVYDLKHAGLQALNSLRLEKGYRDYGHDIDNMDTPLEAGLGFAVKLDKADGFIGQKALAKQKAEGTLGGRLLQFKLNDSKPLLHHAELIYRNGEFCGYMRAGAYGFTLGASVGLGFVESQPLISSDEVQNDSWEIEIAGNKYPAQASLRPLFDPKMERIKC
ncbi:FAD-dependent oxidoreductase [Thalassotalea psychrophila]|uniref:FAD-dependent oxidoreductase n=1 Tax=Thalassotalea psychrophila TaxID=3065647 RepID=A0ABY9TT46_9GAMM|nr:FAD-dependent oxidoreductase [Colwelliaceae bacterium SQ149]